MTKKSGASDFKYLIDSRNLSEKEKRNVSDALTNAREKRFLERGENEKKAARLLQLKYQMEAYLTSSEVVPEPQFPKYLGIYIDILYRKRKNFAADLSVTPVLLSHVLNGHREPQESFLQRLIVHTSSSYKSIGDFDLELWPKVYYQDKIHKFFISKPKWEKTEKKFVTGKELDLAG
ncbi:hypothetical protein [Jiulongibacter sp. NS-SX5]|uniref:hypothetical protein n=1 Tax=Jiulongibacter sp. NS-SX5 TaxID=3463854 RepID=UPI004059DB29